MQLQANKAKTRKKKKDGKKVGKKKNHILLQDIIEHVQNFRARYRYEDKREKSDKLEDIWSMYDVRRKKMIMIEDAHALAMECG